MYTLEINFLRDRNGYGPDPSARKTTVPRSDTLGPLAVGALVGAIIVGAGLLFHIWTQTSIAARQQELEDLQRKRQELQQQQQEIDRLSQELEQTRAQTKALVTIFDRIRPWSALMQDVRNRVPSGIQIQSIKQVKSTPQQASAAQTQQAQTTLPSDTVTITGQSRTNEAISDFVLALQNSNFLNAKQTFLSKLELNEDEKLLFPVVNFEITSALGTTPASQQLSALEREGAVGLVERIRTLQQTGALNP